MGVFDYFKDIISQLGPNKFRTNTLRQIGQQVQPYNPNARDMSFRFGRDETNPVPLTPSFNPNIPDTRTGGFTPEEMDKIISSGGSLEDFNNFVIEEIPQNRRRTIPRAAQMWNEGMGQLVNPVSPTTRPATGLVANQPNQSVDPNAAQYALMSGAPGVVNPVGPQDTQGGTVAPPTETPMQNWGTTIYDDPSLRTGTDGVVTPGVKMAPDALTRPGTPLPTPEMPQNPVYVISGGRVYDSATGALTDVSPEQAAAVNDAESRAAFSREAGLRTGVQLRPVEAVPVQFTFRGESAYLGPRGEIKSLKTKATIGNLRDLPQNVLNGKRVYTVGDTIIDEGGRPVSNITYARSDRDFAFNEQLDRIKAERRVAEAAGNKRRLLELDVEEARIREKWVESRPEDTSRSFMDVLKGIGLGALQAYAKTGNLGSALGGGIAGGIGTAIRPEIAQRWQDAMFRLPQAQAKVATAQGKLDAFNKQEATNRAAMTEELKLRTEISESYRKRLENSEKYRQIFINGDGYATPDQIKAIDDEVGWSTGLIPYLPKASGMQQSKLPNGQLAYITPLGNVILASVRTEKGVEPIQYKSEAEMPVTIQGAQFFLNSKDAAKVVGELAQKNLDIAMRETTENNRRDMALMRYGAMGDLQRSRALTQLTKLDYKDKKAGQAIADAVKERERLTAEMASRLQILDPQGNVVVQLREEDLGGSELTYVRQLKTRIAALDAQINQLALAQEESKALMGLINDANPVVLTPAGSNPVQFPRIGIGVAPQGKQMTVPASRVDQVIQQKK